MASARDMSAAPAVDWRQEVAALRSSSHWAALLQELEGAAGGPIVAALLVRAAAAAGGVAGGEAGIRSGGSRSRSSGGSTARLAEAVQQISWEKLHTGDWHTVAVVWRDAYAAASIVAAAAGLPGAAQPAAAAGAGPAVPVAVDAPAAGAAAPLVTAVTNPAAAGGSAAADASGATAAADPAAAECAALASALWHLDMAAIMGGERLRPQVDSLIELLQRRWQQLQAAGGADERQAGEQRRDEEVGEGAREPPAKRYRAAAQAAMAEGGAASGEASAAAAAADAVLLPPWSLGPRGTPVASAQLPSLESFWRLFMSTDTPVVISGAMEDWPALRRWSDPAYLIRVAGPRTVPVEVGEHYLSEQWSQQLMTLQQFVHHHILGSRGPGSPGRSGGSAGPRPGPGPGSSGGGGDGSSGGRSQLQRQPRQPQEEGGQGRGDSSPAPQQQPQQLPPQQQAQQLPLPQKAPQRAYLAQHPLFDQIPALAADIREPPYCALGEEGEVQSINAWFGPASTVTPLHTDPHPNLLCQAVGRKYVRLYSPAHTAAMYPHEEGMHTNSGRVDVDAPDLGQFPLFGAAPFQDCVLEAGQMLFIPPGWWHYVKSTTVSFSVSFWWR